MALLAVTHGVYYLTTGIWPIASSATFQAVTGPKRDVWLVKTAGLLIAVIGAVLILAGARRRVNSETAVLGVGAAVSLAAIDLTYVRKRVIGPIYLADAAGEIVLATSWLAGRVSRERQSG